MTTTTYMFTAEMRRTEDDWLVVQIQPRLREAQSPPGIRGPFNRTKTISMDAQELQDLMRKCGQVVIGG